MMAQNKEEIIADIIRRGEEDLKNGNVESWNITLKELKVLKSRGKK